MTLMFVSSSQNLQVHSFWSCRITDSVVFDFSKTGEIKLPHFVHTRHYKAHMEMLRHENSVTLTYDLSEQFNSLSCNRKELP